MPENEVLELCDNSVPFAYGSQAHRARFSQTCEDRFGQVGGHGNLSFTFDCAERIEILEALSNFVCKICREMAVRANIPSFSSLQAVAKQA